MWGLPPISKSEMNVYLLNIKKWLPSGGKFDQIPSREGLSLAAQQLLALTANGKEILHTGEGLSEAAVVV